MKNVSGDHAVGVDPHHGRCLSVERDGADRFPQPRPANERDQRDHEGDGEDEDHQSEVLDEHTAVTAEMDPVVADQGEAVVVAVLRAEEQERRVLEKERHAERRDERRDPRSVAKRPIRKALDREPEEARAEHGDREHAEDEQHDRNRRG